MLSLYYLRKTQPDKHFSTDPNVKNIKIYFIFTGNSEESLHEGDIKLSLNQEIALELFGDPTAPVLGARGITNNKNLLWIPNVVPYNISRELGTLYLS